MKVFLLTIFLISGYNAQSPKVGQSTRYWDCCKPSCAWSGKATVTKPVLACSADGVTNVDMNAGSGCNGGNSYTCSNNQPWAINSTVSYGFVAAKMVGLTESNWCCACYQMTFTSGPVVGKKMVVQVTNTGGDLGDNHFDIQIPGGGVGLFNGCTSQWGAPDAGWGQRYGGVSSRSDCDALPAQIRAGCQWRFDWFLNADNPSFTFIQVTCPAAITAKTGCIRTA